MKIDYFKVNFIFIGLFLIFLIFFPAIKSSFNDSGSKEENQMNMPNSFLSSVNNSSNAFTGFFVGIKDYFVSKKDLENQILDLKSQIQKSQYNSLLTSSVVSDKSLSKDGPVLAKKVFSDFTSIYDTVILNKGFLNGVEKGDIVFLYPNQLLGQIESINSNTSILSLYSKDKNKLEAVLKAKKSNDVISIDQSQSTTSSSSEEIISTSSSPFFSSSSVFNPNPNFKIKNDSGGSNIIIDIYGNGSGDFTASLPDNIKVATGTIIYLSSDESKALGEVVKVENQEASFFQNIFIRGYYNTRTNDDYYIMHK
ncbi:MAG: rod shape-determining protein MreC [Candidatus Nomurabacteria bacterium]